MELTKPVKVISLILKVIVFVSAILGTIISAIAGREHFMGGSTVFMYFTIQSNILMALICLIGAVIMLKRGKFSAAWYVIKLVGTVSITLTGVVFCFILAPTIKIEAWSLANILTHVVVPLASIVDFFVTGVYSNIKVKYVFFVLIPPLLYAAYAGIGFVRGWQFSPGHNYPYFFLDWGSPAGAFGFTKDLPFMGSGWWIIALMILLLIFGLLYLGILGLLKKIVKH